MLVRQKQPRIFSLSMIKRSITDSRDWIPARNQNRKNNLNLSSLFHLFGSNSSWKTEGEEQQSELADKMHHQSNTTSWRKLEPESRSTSFPAAVSLHNPLASSSTRDRPLSSPPRDLTGRLKRKTTDIESSRVPVLIVTMIKIHDVFEAFCGCLKDTTFLNAQAACLALDSAETKASENFSETIMDSPTSPSRSPMSWFKSSYNPQSEIEWEKASAPLIVFAGLEAIYCSLSHLGSSHVQEFLVRLYRRTSLQLRLMKEALCDPFVYSTRKEESVSPSTMSSYKTKAVDLSLSIEAIMVRAHSEDLNSNPNLTKRLTNFLLFSISHCVIADANWLNNTFNYALQKILMPKKSPRPFSAFYMTYRRRWRDHGQS